MSKFALNRIESVNGKQQFFKLLIDGKCQLDEFEIEISKGSKLESELGSIYQYMNFVSHGQSLPKSKFRVLQNSKGPIKEYEFKTKNLRFYAIKIDNGQLVILGGRKSNQKRDLNKFRKIKQRYIDSK